MLWKLWCFNALSLKVLQIHFTISGLKNGLVHEQNICRRRYDNKQNRKRKTNNMNICISKETFTA